MPDTPFLLQQLAHRAIRFHENTGIAKATLGKAISVNESNYCAFLAGKRGVSANSTCMLLKYMNMTASDVVATLSRNTLSSKITSLQVKGKHMKLSNDGWVPGQSGVDINTGVGQSIAVPPLPHNAHDCLAVTVEMLNGLNDLHRQAISAISAFIQQAKINQGTTAPNDQRFAAKNMVFR
jgi:hypothetical protein